MPVLQLELRVHDYDTWKAGFDRDPVGREEQGVRRHRVLRSADDPNAVVVLLEFDDDRQAEAMRITLREAWDKLWDELGFEEANARVMDDVETKDYGGR